MFRSLLLLIMFDLQFCSWNATGLMSSAYNLSKVLDQKSVDICGLSEHWLFPSDMHFLNSKHPKNNSLGLCNSDFNKYRSKKVGKGGVVFLWKKSLDDSIFPLSIDSDRIIGKQV